MHSSVSELKRSPLLIFHFNHAVGVTAVCKLSIPLCLFPEVKYMWFRNLHPVYDVFSFYHQPGKRWDRDNTKKQSHKG